MTIIKHTLPKTERLHGKKNIDALFAKGRVLVSYPYRLIYDFNEEAEIQPQVMVSVPKRIFKRAVHRNWIKRRVKESYRLRKQTLIESLNSKSLTVAFLYIAKEKHDYEFLDKKMGKALDKLMSELNKD